MKSATTPEGLKQEARGFLACGHDKEQGAYLGCDGSEEGCRLPDKLLSDRYWAEKRALEGNRIERH